MLQRNKPSVIQQMKDVADGIFKKIKRTMRPPRLLESSGYVILKRIREDKYSKRS